MRLFSRYLRSQSMHHRIHHLHRNGIKLLSLIRDAFLQNLGTSALIHPIFLDRIHQRIYHKYHADEQIRKSQRYIFTIELTDRRICIPPKTDEDCNQIRKIDHDTSSDSKHKHNTTGINQQKHHTKGSDQCVIVNEKYRQAKQREHNGIQPHAAMLSLNPYIQSQYPYHDHQYNLVFH